jgi:predicted phosphoribosyltransferase
MGDPPDRGFVETSVPVDAVLIVPRGIAHGARARAAGSVH